MISQGSTRVGLAHRGPPRRQTRSSTLRARSRDSMVRILQENPLRGVPTVSQNENRPSSIVRSIPESITLLTRTFAVHGRPLRDCCDTRPVFWVAMSIENRSPTRRKGTTVGARCRGYFPPASAPTSPFLQLDPLLGPDARSAARFIAHLTVTEPQSLSSAYHRQLLKTPRHTHLQPVAERVPEC